MQALEVSELVDILSALEPKVLENGERSVDGQAVDVQDAGLLDHIVRVILLVDADRDAVRAARELRDRIHDEAVVLSAIVAGDDIEAVADLEKGLEVILVCLLVGAGNIILAELIREGLELLGGILLERRADRHLIFRKINVAALREHFLNDLDDLRRPCAVLNDADRSLLEASLRQAVDEVAHKRINIGVVGRRRKNKLAVPERVRNRL